MNTEFYEEIQKAFIDIRSHSSCNTFTEVALKHAKKEILKEKKTEDNKLLLYCIDTMFDILNERNKDKIRDFADTVHNIPEISMGFRDFYSFKAEIEDFRSKYGTKYFSDFDKVKPRFSKYASKNSWKYLLPNADDDFKAVHPTAYKWLRFFGVMAICLPMIVYIVICCFTPHVWDNGFVLIGYAGSIMIGVGLFNVLSAFVHQYMGHKMTIICLGGGSFLVLLAWILFRFVI